MKTLSAGIMGILLLTARTSAIAQTEFHLQYGRI